MTDKPKPKVATVWLDGCSGCHMSFLDMDERLITLAGLVDIVHSPIVDPKDFPHDVDITLVEGAVSSEEDLHKALVIRERSKLVISLGDCAVTGNVPAMRNPFKPNDLLERAYIENASAPALAERKAPASYLPPLLPKAKPIHEVIKIDLYLPGCPPPADAIFQILVDLLEGREPDINALTRFGK